MNQSFDARELKKFCKREEYIEFKLSVSELEMQLNSIYQNILDESFDFEIKQVGSYFLSESLVNKLILRKLNDNIKRIYKDEQANRNTIISQIKVLLEGDSPSWIVKTDIKKFYESIDRNTLVDKFRNDSILSYHSIFLLDKLFSNKIISNSSGIPRGMNISATLSEIYMRKFDKWIKNCEGIFYYARFVDDIIIFSNSLQNAQDLMRYLDEKLGKLATGLVINKMKTQLLDGLTLKQLCICNGVNSKDNHLEYLGYKFIKTKKDIRISIADKKLKKIKTRITLSFIDYSNNKNFELLNNRIKFLTGNYGIKKSSEGSILKAGIYFNYSQLIDITQLEELTGYYRKILYCKKGKLGIALNFLSAIQRNKLKKYCFKAGFENKICNTFSNSQMVKIVKCWNYGKN
jgi:hypothetical protein